MEDKPNYRYYLDEKYDKISRQIFNRFIVIFFCAYLLLMGFTFIFYQNYSYVTISGKSMMNTLNPNPVEVFTEKGIEYLQDGVYIKHTQNVEHGDIVVIDVSSQNTEKKTIIKRVIGKEGDFVTIARVDDDYHVIRIIAGTDRPEVLQEEYIYSYTDWAPNGVAINGVIYDEGFYSNYKNYFNYKSQNFRVEELDDKNVIFFQVPEDCVFALGDNRSQSLDSRSRDYGCFETKQIEGRVVDIVRNGSEYNGNNLWWFNRILGFFRTAWKGFLGIFGVNA